MITIESVLSKKNQRQAMNFLLKKKNGSGSDHMPLSDLEQYWNLNKTDICAEIMEKEYLPGAVVNYDIVGSNGKKRTVSQLTTIDRYITRLISQKLNQFYSHLFLSSSHAYQEAKGIMTAVEQAATYIENGHEYVVEIDIKNFFDNISIPKLMDVLKQEIKDECVLYLIESYLYCSVISDGRIDKKEKGLIQGCSMSPILSNIYLMELDFFMENRGYLWVRFADDINIYVSSIDEGKQIYEDMYMQITKKLLLEINESKSGIYDVFERRMLGYDFIKRKNHVVVQRHIYQKKNHFHSWHEGVIRKVNREYHILQNGILNKKDYAMLFENEEKKHHIPVEATEQINVYNDITLSTSVLRTLSYEKIRLGVYDNYGNLLGYFIPEAYHQDATVVLNQYKIYCDTKLRFRLALKMEIAALHNLRANLRYYDKHIESGLDVEIKQISSYIMQLNQKKTIEELLLIACK